MEKANCSTNSADGATLSLGGESEQGLKAVGMRVARVLASAAVAGKMLAEATIDPLRWYCGPDRASVAVDQSYSGIEDTGMGRVIDRA